MYLGLPRPAPSTLELSQLLGGLLPSSICLPCFVQAPPMGFKERGNLVAILYRDACSRKNPPPSTVSKDSITSAINACSVPKPQRHRNLAANLHLRSATRVHSCRLCKHSTRAWYAAPPYEAMACNEKPTTIVRLRTNGAQSNVMITWRSNELETTN
jgi:hypothetical protein